MIECVPNSKSRDQLGKATQVSLKNYFNSRYGDDDSVPFQKVRQQRLKYHVKCMPIHVTNTSDMHTNAYDMHGFVQARANFIKSMSAYSLISYILQVKDRHNGNIMIDGDGHIIHIGEGNKF